MYINSIITIVTSMIWLTFVLSIISHNFTFKRLIKISSIIISFNTVLICIQLYAINDQEEGNFMFIIVFRTLINLSKLYNKIDIKYCRKIPKQKKMERVWS